MNKGIDYITYKKDACIDIYLHDINNTLPDSIVIQTRFVHNHLAITEIRGWRTLHHNNDGNSTLFIPIIEMRLIDIKMLVRENKNNKKFIKLVRKYFNDIVGDKN